VGSDSFSARERLQWEAEHNPSATARVAAAKRLLDDEPKLEEPEPEADGPRGISLAAVFELAQSLGVGPDMRPVTSMAEAFVEDVSRARPDASRGSDGNPLSDSETEETEVVMARKARGAPAS